MYIEEHLKQQFASANISSNYKGRICIFDLDKTYLDTNFETFWGLIKIPFESAYDKKNIAGAHSIVRALNRTKENEIIPLIFISGSPKQMRNVILKKFDFDGIHCEAIIFKDLLTPLKKLQLKKMIDKIGYKLAALLYSYLHFPPNGYQILFGDDSEYDATVYSLYADLIEGNISENELLQILTQWKIYEDEIKIILRLYQKALKEKSGKSQNKVKQIFIHLEIGNTPNNELVFSDKVIPTYNYFQTVILLYQLDELDFVAVEKVLFELVYQYHFSLEHLLESLEDLLLRELITKAQLDSLIENLKQSEILSLPNRWYNEIEIFLEQKETINRKKETTLKKKQMSNNYQVYISYVPKRHLGA